MRRLAPRWSPVVLGMLLLGVITPARAGMAPTLSIAVSSQDIRYGQTVTVTAHLTESGSTTNKSVSIWWWPVDGAEELVAEGEVDTDGTFAIQHAPDRSGSYHAHWEGDETQSPQVSELENVFVQAVLKLRLRGYVARNAQGVPIYRLGDAVRYEGRLIPQHDARLRIFVQVRRRGIWYGLPDESAQVDESGAYSGSVIRSRPRTYRLRARFHGHRDHLTATTGWRRFVVRA